MDAESPASLLPSGTGESTANQMANQDSPVPPPVRPPSPFAPSTSKSRRFHLPRRSVTGITNGKMGQAQSINSNKFKRAFGPRWKKSDETEKEEKDRVWDNDRDRSGDDNSSIPAQTLPHLSTSLPLSASNPPPSSIARHLGKLAPRKLSVSSTVPPLPVQSIPAPSPPQPPLSPQLCTKPDPSASDNAPVIINSPGISAAVQFMRQQESQQAPIRSDDPSPVQHVEHERRVHGPNDHPTKDDWRKSDSTMASHVTIRPGAGLPRATRPVSVAESAHSVNTIVPSSRRVSMIVPDSDLVEENDSDTEEAEPITTIKPSLQSSSTPSLGLTNTPRRQSTFFGSMTSFHSRTESEQEPPLSHRSHSVSKRQLLGSSRGVSPIWADANEHGFLSNNNERFRSLGSGIRGRLAAWASNDNRHSPPPSPSPELDRSTSPKLPGGFRQTTLSISGNLAPAAIDLGKRAMEKIGRSWGSKYTHPPGQSSSRSDLVSNSTPPPSHKGKFSEYINRSHLNNSGSSQSISLSNSSKHKRRTPGGPSGTWSISSSQSSVSIDDKMSTQSGTPSLNFGQIMRGPLSTGGGAVFGRRLADCVRDTAVDDVKQKLLSGEYYGEGWDVDKIPPLQDRLLPALVLRCVQHLLAWGIQEEGLFRYAFGSNGVLEIENSSPPF